LHELTFSRIEAGRRDDRGAFSFYALRPIDGSRGQVLVKEASEGSARVARLIECSKVSKISTPAKARDLG